MTRRKQNQSLNDMETDTTLAEITGFWRDNGRDIVKKSLDSLDEVAKQILVVAGVLVGLYFNAITFGNLKGSINTSSMILFIAPIVFLLIVIFASLCVFFPATYHINIANWKDCKTKFEHIGNTKLKAVRAASIFLTLSILLIVLAIVNYLTS